LRRAFKDRDWPGSYFAKTFITDEQFLLALADLDEMWRGDRYIQHPRDEASDGGFEWSASQLAAFKRFNMNNGSVLLAVLEPKLLPGFEPFALGRFSHDHDRSSKPEQKLAEGVSAQ
jgi:hypothetical protein